MTRAQLLLALSAITGTASMLPASDCDGKGKGKGSCQTIQDDRGLLDVVDDVAGRIHSGFSSSFSRMAKLSSRFDRPHVSRGSRGCDCDSCQASNEMQGMQGQYSTDQNFNESNAAPPNGTNQHPPIQLSPDAPADVPPSLRVPSPTPDAQINPFMDEPVRSGSGRVRGRTIQYQQGARPIYQNAPYPAPAPSRGTTKPQYGQQYNSQAQSGGTASADYWSESNKKTQKLQLVAPASSQTQTLEEVFRPAYRVSLSDADEQAQQSNSTPPMSLRPVQTKDSSESGSSRRQSVKVDRYEREDSVQQPSYENPLRR
jgi:hypothetical protein